MAAYFAIGRTRFFHGSLANCLGWARVEAVSTKDPVKIFRARAGEKTARSILYVCESSIEAFCNDEIKLDSLKRHRRRG